MLKSKIQEDLKAALKSGLEIELSTLRMLLASLASRETEKRTKIWKEKPDLPISEIEEKGRLIDEEIIEAISSEIKKRREAISGYEKGGRQESADKEKKEMEVLQKYLPEQLGEEEIKKLVKEAVAKTGAKEQKDIGKVMTELMPKVKGKADASLVSKIVKELLISR
ncbi:MAG: GatB/YqeY domain-containing protein [bacterium]